MSTSPIASVDIADTPVDSLDGAAKLWLESDSTKQASPRSLAKTGVEPLLPAVDHDADESFGDAMPADSGLLSTSLDDAAELVVQQRSLAKTDVEPLLSAVDHNTDESSGDAMPADSGLLSTSLDDAAEFVVQPDNAMWPVGANQTLQNAPTDAIPSSLVNYGTSELLSDADNDSLETPNPTFPTFVEALSVFTTVTAAPKPVPSLRPRVKLQNFEDSRKKRAEAGGEVVFTSDHIHKQ